MTPPFQVLALAGSTAAVSFGAALILTPVAAAAARRLGVMDRPDAVLKPHARATPYLGGAAIAAGWALACTLAWSIPLWPRVSSVIPIVGSALPPLIVGGLGLFTLGLLDDLKNLSPRLRLVVSAVVVGLVLLASGIADGLTHVLLASLRGVLPGAVVLGLALLAGIFVVLSACNSSNLIDGLDGLCGGVMAVVGLGFAALFWLYSPAPGLSAGLVGVTIASAMCGACLGFLPYNVKPARIFMGDAGSMLLGYCGGLLILAAAALGGWKLLLSGVLIYGLPTMDTALAITRRWRSGKPLFKGDRSHFYDQLVQRGLSVRATSALCWAVTAGLALAGLLLAALPLWMAGLGFAAVWLTTALALLRAGFVNPEQREMRI